jgi:hypothetical protein
VRVDRDRLLSEQSIGSVGSVEFKLGNLNVTSSLPQQLFCGQSLSETSIGQVKKKPENS